MHGNCTKRQKIDWKYSHTGTMSQITKLSKCKMLRNEIIKYKWKLKLRIQRERVS